MPVYEYQCFKCGNISSFMEKMNEMPPLLFGRKRCKHCGSKKINKVVSGFAAKAERTNVEMLNELKSMGNVSFSPPPPKPPWGDGPPPGGCPYERAEKEEQEKKKNERPKQETITIR